MNMASKNYVIGTFLSVFFILASINFISPSIVIADEVHLEMGFQQANFGPRLVIKNTSNFPVNILLVNLKMKNSRLSHQIALFSLLTPGQSLGTPLYGANYKDVTQVTVETNRGNVVVKDIPMFP